MKTCFGKVSKVSLIDFSSALIPLYSCSAITETLEADVRSSFQTKKVIEGHKSGYHFEIPFDGVLVRYEWTEERVIAITDVLRVEEGSDASAKEIFKEDKNVHEVDSSS